MAQFRVQLHNSLPCLHVIMLFLVIILTTFIDISWTLPAKLETCGYESCPSVKDGLINIHLVSHTHDDVGWLKTDQQYFYGSNNSIQRAGVQYILDSVVQELLLDPEKRFIYVETSFFWMWWEEQSDHLQEQVKQLVNSGRLEFIGGAWTMNDEASTHYQSIIDQFTWGFRKLEDTFGRCGRPRVGWQIDPFGHSIENAAIMAGLGFDGLFLGRIDWEDKMNRKLNKTMEMLWHVNPDASGDDGKLFTGILYNTYSAPKGFCFDIFCSDEPIIDRKSSVLYNAERRVSEFLRTMDNYTQVYRSKHIIVTMGDDFQYQNAHVNFKNMDKLIKHINSRSTKYHAFYSTPSCYLQAVNKEKIPLPSKKDDFFPYSNDPNSFWTGYFSSRPTIKGYERIGNNYLQVCKQLQSLSGLRDNETGNLDALREAMGVMQHHDAVTGTEKEHVAADYSRILTSAIAECDQISNDAFKKLVGSPDLPQLHSCLLLNISSCPQTEESESFVLTLYNPLSRHLTHLVRAPVTSLKYSYTVKSPKGKELTVQLVPLSDAVVNIPGRPGKAIAELVFLAEDLPPLGFMSYHITKTEGPADDELSQEIPLIGEAITVGFEKNGLILSSNNRLKGVKLNGENHPVGQSFFYYHSAIGNNEICLNRSSGAYVFRPNGSEILVNPDPRTQVYTGPVVAEVRFLYNDWLSETIRIVNHSSAMLEFEWLVGPIPIENGVGKEIVTRFTSPDIKSNKKFVTDSNGRSHLVRTRNHRDSWDVHLAEEVSGNYYPVVTDITIEDESKGDRLSIITDRAQGGSSLEDGIIELMIHRRITHDDAFGVSEPLNETAFGQGLVVRGKHWLFMGDPEELRVRVQEKVLSPWTYLSPTQLTYEQWNEKYKTEYSGLTEALPKEVQILTLEPWSQGRYLLRLESITSNPPPITVDISNLFEGFSVEEVKEMALGGDVEKSTVTRLIWEEENMTSGHTRHTSDTNEISSNKITLNSKDIKTFLVKLSPKVQHKPS